MNSFRGYIDFEIGGEIRPVKFDFNTLADISDKHGLSLTELRNLDSKRMTATVLRTLVWSGLVHGARTAGKDVDFTLEDVGSWVGELMKSNRLVELLTTYGKAVGGPDAATGAKKKTRAVTSGK